MLHFRCCLIIFSSMPLFFRFSPLLMLLPLFAAFLSPLFFRYVVAFADAIFHFVMLIIAADVSLICHTT